MYSPASIPSSTRTLAFLTVVISIFFAASTLSPVQADEMLIWVEEIGGDVVFHHEGSIDLTGLRMQGSGPFSPSIEPRAGSYVGGQSGDLYGEALPNASSRTFGSGGYKTTTAFEGATFSSDTETYLWVPKDYTSGSPIKGSMTFPGQTLTSLGINAAPFSYNTSGGTNTIYMFTTPSEFAAIVAAQAATKANLEKKIQKLLKKGKKLKKKGKKAKAKKLSKKAKKLQAELADLE